MNIRGKRLLIGGTVALVIIIALMILPYLGRLTPATLQIHISGKAWDRVTVTTQFVNHAPKTFSPSDKIIVRPISHGPYYIQIDFAGGQIFWVQYFHTDASVRRAVDIYLAGSPENDTVEVRAVAYGDKEIYSNTVVSSSLSDLKNANASCPCRFCALAPLPEARRACRRRIWRQGLLVASRNREGSWAESRFYGTIAGDRPIAACPFAWTRRNKRLKL